MPIVNRANHWIFHLFPALITLSWALQPSHAQQYLFESYGPSHGLTSPVIHSIAQDKQGLLWIGTTNGLFRFDGYRATRFDQADGLPDANVLCLHFASDGRLWIGTWKGLAWRNPDGRFSRPAELPFQSAIPVQGIHSLPGGPILVATKSGLAVVSQVTPSDSLEYQILPKAERARNTFIASVFALEDGGILYGCGLGVCRYKNNQTQYWVYPKAWLKRTVGSIKACLSPRLERSGSATTPDSTDSTQLKKNSIVYRENRCLVSSIPTLPSFGPAPRLWFLLSKGLPYTRRVTGFGSSEHRMG